MSRDGRAHGDGGSDSEGSAEGTERRGDAAGDGEVPFRVLGQGLSWLSVYRTARHNVLIVNGFLTRPVTVNKVSGDIML